MDDPFLNRDVAIARLYNDYKNHKNLVVAFDFDNTIHDYHKAGDNYPKLIALLQQCSDLGFTMLCFTGNGDTQLVEDTCSANRIRMDYLNESPVKLETIKPFYNILLDDRAGLASAYDTLVATINIIITETVKKM